MASESEHLPGPTYWPAALALACVFLLWGIVASYIISAVGLLLLVAALVGWIGELVHERHASDER